MLGSLVNLPQRKRLAADACMSSEAELAGQKCDRHSWLPALPSHSLGDTCSFCTGASTPLHLPPLLLAWLLQDGLD